MTASPLHLPLALALERRPDASGSGRPLSPAEAERFAQLVAQDLARLVPGVERLDLALSAACHDPAELLRPGWPLHAALGELAARAPGSREAGGRIIAFGRAPEGFAAPALEPDASLGGAVVCPGATNLITGQANPNFAGASNPRNFSLAPGAPTGPSAQ